MALKFQISNWLSHQIFKINPQRCLKNSDPHVGSGLRAKGEIRQNLSIDWVIKKDFKQVNGCIKHISYQKWRQKLFFAHYYSVKKFAEQRKYMLWKRWRCKVLRSVGISRDIIKYMCTITRPLSGAISRSLSSHSAELAKSAADRGCQSSFIHARRNYSLSLTTQ